MPIAPDIQFQPHQQRLQDEASIARETGDPFRRLVLWGVGTGKTIGALGAADALGGQTTVVAPAAVRSSFRQEANRTVPGSNIPIVSYQGAASGKAPPADNMIVDEAQRLGSVGSAQAARVAEIARKAKNVVMLSGTPIRNHPREFAPILSILTGKPISHDEFEERYVGNEKIRPGFFARLRGVPTVERPSLQNTEELKALLAGKIDYYENTTPPVGAPSSVKYEDVESEMMPGQTQLYQGFWDKLPYVTKWKLKHRYDLTDSELARAQSFMVGPRQAALSDLPYRPDGDPLAAFENSGKLRTAMDRMRAKLDSNPSAKGIVYSNYPKAGLQPYAAALAKLGIPHAVFDGKLTDEERKHLVNNFNSGQTRVALVGPAGAEGISLKGSQLIQLLDNHWNQARMTQAQARGVRFDSHVGLPEDLRGVTIERHIAKLPLGYKDRMLTQLGFDRRGQQSAVDDYLRDLSARKEHLNTQLTDLLRDVGTHNKQSEEKINVGELLKWAREEVGVIDPEDAEKIAALQELVPNAMGVQPPDDVLTRRADQNWQPRVRVVMPHGDGYLLEELHNPKYPQNLGKTRFPGGGVDPGETLYEAAARELHEELGSQADPSQFEYLGRDSRPTHDYEHYLKWVKHPLKPGQYAASVGGDAIVHLVGGQPAGEKYFGADLGNLKKADADPLAVENEKLKHIREMLARLRAEADAAGYHYFAIANAPTHPTAGAEVSSVPRQDKNNVITRYADLHKSWSQSNGYGDVDWSKTADASVPHTNQFRQAKSFSDMGTPEGYARKTHVIRQMISESPADWRIDSVLNPGIVGVTHKSGWRYHLPVGHVRDLLEMPKVQHAA